MCVRRITIYKKQNAAAKYKRRRNDAAVKRRHAAAKISAYNNMSINKEKINDFVKNNVNTIKTIQTTIIYYHTSRFRQNVV